LFGIIRTISEEFGCGPGVDYVKDAGCMQQLAVRLDAEQVRGLSAAAACVCHHCCGLITVVNGLHINHVLQFHSVVTKTPCIKFIV